MDEYIEVHVVRSVGRDFCLCINDTRVAGGHPTLTKNNVLKKWRVKVADILEALPKLKEGP